MLIHKGCITMRTKTNTRIVESLLSYHDELLSCIPEIDTFIEELNALNAVYDEKGITVAESKLKSNDSLFRRLFKRMSQVYEISTIAKILDISREWIYHHGARSHFSKAKKLILSKEVLDGMSVTVHGKSFILNSTGIVSKFQVSKGRAKRMGQVAKKALKSKSYITEKGLALVKYMLENESQSLTDIAALRNISYTSILMIKRRYFGNGADKVEKPYAYPCK